jgi:hypothetical protein
VTVLAAAQRFERSQKDLGGMSAPGGLFVQVAVAIDALNVTVV